MFPPPDALGFPLGFIVRGLDTGDIKPIPGTKYCMGVEEYGPSVFVFNCDTKDKVNCGVVLKRWVPKVPGPLQYPEDMQGYPVSGADGVLRDLTEGMPVLPVQLMLLLLLLPMLMHWHAQHALQAKMGCHSSCSFMISTCSKCHGLQQR